MTTNKRYQIIYADPPWRYSCKNPPSKIEKQPEKCSVEYYYKTMSLEEIKNLNVKEIAEKDSVLFLWSTTPMIQEALEVMKSWGFKYKTMITWEKINKDCMGYYFKVCTEHLLVGVKGKIKSFRNMQRTLYSSKRGKHSQKPVFFRELINSIGFDKKIELFARKENTLFEDLSWKGWDVWGNEIKSDIKL